MLSTARYIKHLEEIAMNYKTQAMNLNEQNKRLIKAAKLLETALQDMRGFSESSCNACKHLKGERCDLGRIAKCKFQWIHEDEAMRAIRSDDIWQQTSLQSESSQ